MKIKRICRTKSVIVHRITDCAHCVILRTMDIPIKFTSSRKQAVRVEVIAPSWSEYIEH